MTNTYSNEIRIVIGSWGSYNECNERALGSQWMDLADFDSWDEIEEALSNQGFELDGIDEELFIPDIVHFTHATNPNHPAERMVRICFCFNQNSWSRDPPHSW